MSDAPAQQAGHGYDAVVVVSFGGPEGPDDVMPFLERVTAGRPIPRERLEEVRAHYDRFAGVSPINGHNRRLVTHVAAALAAEGPELPVYLGNRNWHPLLTDTLSTMAADGVTRALAFVTSAFASYPGCRRYLEDIEAARAAVGPRAPVVDKLRLFWNHPGFIEPLAARVAETVASLESCVRDRARLLFSAHSIPMALASSGDYQAQLGDAAALVATRAGQADRQWELVFQSRSGPPSEPWLEPDIGDRLEALAAGGCPAVVVVPLGFVSDHMEVVYDLDIVARARAEASGLSMVRVPTVGDTPAFVAMVVELVRERVWPDRTPRRALGRRGPWPDTCPLGCCPPPAPTAPPS